ncbi:hypothetical protein A3H83_02075 [Candidatus Roizmanbacteria bacterium RIFCSPLOWO2_02_FULL_39_8]|nr:MAG: hypothetical protein A3H83_02075 [Candidatus Roizmanbacteria bacterium RIFCSPLOWO2_02_FULL_39_8]
MTQNKTMDIEQEYKPMQVEKKEEFIITSIIVTFLVLLLLGKALNQRVKEQSSAQTQQEIGVQVLSPLSNTEFSGSTGSIDLRSNTQNGVDVLYDSSVTGEAAVLDFMDKNPYIDPTAVSNNVEVKGASTESEKLRVLPANFRQNSTLSRTVNDRMFKDKSEIKHYYYTQKVAGLPVYGAVVRFDLAGGDKIVGVDGEYTLSTNTTPIKLSDQQAIDSALAKATEEIKKTDPNLRGVLCSGETPSRKVFNEKIAGLSDKDANNAVLDVVVCDHNNDSLHLFKHSYFVSLDTGTILSDYNMLYESLNRSVSNCSGGCRVSRTEGQGPVSDADTNKSYDILGEVYNFYFNSFQRDSYDNHGATIKARVHASVPNAQWDGYYMSAATGWIAKDIWAHELTHAVTQYTSGLGRGPQQGALNESLSDIFGYGVDSANWTMGEASRVGAIRDISNPHAFGQPDRIFDSRFSCSGEVHRNNGPTNKAFYLMTIGGAHNGCTISGIGKEKSLAVIYKANTTYLGPSSGFFDFNNKVNQACGDLYGATSSECLNVKAALQATELDQNRCGGGASRKTPICAGGTQPTVGPTSAAPTSTAPTNTPQGPKPTSGGSPSTTSLTATPAQIPPTVEPTATPTAGQGTTPANSPTPGPGTPTVDPTTTKVVLSMKLRFQGIGGGVERGDGSMVVRVGITGGDLDTPVYNLVPFASSDAGIWTGSATFPTVSAGTKYCILVKGPTHSQKKVCHVSPLEQLTGSYKAGHSTIPLVLGDNTLDFTGIKMLVGDIDQNGIVNSFDLAYVRNNFEAESPDIIERCDVDWNGVCNGLDYGLMVAAISIKVDDE